MNALKSIYSRITSMEKSEGVLKAVGVSMRDMNGEVRDVSSILGELAGKWSGLSKEQQQNTAVQLAGRYQLTRFLALMQNYSISVSATETALNSQGSAVRENEKYMQSLQARIEKMKTAWETMSIAFGNAVISDSIVVLTSLFASMMNGVAKLVDTVGALPVVLGTVGFAVALLRTSFKLIIIDITKTVASILSIPTATQVATLGLRGLAAAATTAKVALRGLMSATIIGGVFAVIGLGLEWLIGLFSDGTKAAEDFTDKTEELSQKQYDLQSLRKLSEEYNILSNKVNLSFDEKTRLAQIESELSNKYNITTTTVDGQTKSLEANNEAIRTQIGLKEEEVKAARLAAELEYNSNSSQIELEIEREKKTLKEREQAYDVALEAYKKNQDEWAKYQPGSYEYNMGSMANERLAGELQVQKDLLDKSKTDMQQVMNSKVQAFKGAGQSFIDEQESNNVKIGELTRDFVDIYANAAAESGVLPNEFKENLQKAFDAIQKNDLTSAEEAMNLLKTMPGVTELTATSFTNLQAVMSRHSYTPAIEGLEGTTSAVDALGDSLDGAAESAVKFADEVNSTQSDIGELNDVLYNLSKGQSLNTEEMNKLILKYPELAKNVVKLKDGYKIEKSAVEALRNTKVDYFKTLDQLGRQEVINNEKALASKMKIWGIELEALTTLAELNAAKAQVDANISSEIVVEDLTGKGIENQAVLNQAKKAKETAAGPYKDLLDRIYEINTSFKVMVDSLDTLGSARDKDAKATDKAAKSNDKLNNTYTETNEILTKTQEKLIELADAIKKVQNERSTMIKGSKEYIASLKEEKRLLTDKIATQQKALSNPSELVSTKVKTTIKTASGEPAPSSTGTYSLPSTSSKGTYSGKYADIINKYASKNNVDPFLIAAIIQTESSFNPNARSGAGATGLMQLMPGTAKGLGVNNSYDPEQNIAGGTKYIANLLKQYNGKIEYALAAYNAGPGNVNKWIKAGKMGNIPFAETRAYAPKVLANYAALSGSSTPTSKTNTGSATKIKTTSSDGKTTTEIIKPTQKEITDAKRETEMDISSDKAELYQLGLDIVEAVIASTDNEIAKIQSKRELSANKQSRYTQDSAEWRKEEMAQSSYLQQEQKLVEKQNQDIQKQLKEQKITKGEFDAKMAENSAKWWDYQAQIDAKRKSVFDSQIAAYDKQTKSSDDALAISDANLKMLTEGTVEYNKELRSQIPIIENKASVLAKEIAYVESLLANNKLNAEMTQYYTDKLQELNLSLLGTNSALKDVNDRLRDLRESAADKIIEEYKKVIEQQRDLELDAIDKEREAEDKRHEERTKNIDDEQKQFEDYINARLKALDREYASEDYQEELQKKTDERNKILSQINELELDDSIEADAKRKSLKEQLAAAEEEIAKFQRDRERELVKQNLQDQLDARKDHNDDIKKEEDKRHEDELNKLDEEKKVTERKYKDILEDQKYFYELKQGLMSNDALIVSATLGNIGREYDKLFATIKDHTFETSREMQNMVYNFQTSLEGLNKYGIGDYSPVVPGESSGSGSGSDSTGTVKGTTAARVAWTHYLGNKKEAEDIKKQMSTLDKKSAEYKKLTDEFTQLKAKNDQLRSVYGFPDGSYDELVKQKIFSAKTGGMTPSDVPAEGQYILAHKKELILKESDTSNILKVVDIVRNITEKVKSAFNFNAFSPNLSTPAGAVSYGDINVRIDRLNTDESGVESFFRKIASERRKKGV